jgi:hypothetical protein
VLAAMASFYLSTEEAATPAALPVARAVREALDGPADLAMLVFRARLRVRGLLPGSRGWGRGARGAEIVMPARPTSVSGQAPMSTGPASVPAGLASMPASTPGASRASLARAASAGAPGPVAIGEPRTGEKHGIE